MNETKLAEIEARANAATPGPWLTAPQNRFTCAGTVDHKPDIVGEVWPADAEDFGGDEDAAVRTTAADLAFIAAARTDVPALVAEVRRLTAALERARRGGAEAMREWAANVCERMVVGGCAWSEEQATAARALLDAAGNVRALPLDAPGGGS